jgi:hypothetical protein
VDDAREEAVSSWTDAHERAFRVLEGRLRNAFADAIKEFARGEEVAKRFPVGGVWQARKKGKSYNTIREVVATTATSITYKRGNCSKTTCSVGNFEKWIEDNKVEYLYVNRPNEFKIALMEARIR